MGNVSFEHGPYFIEGKPHSGLKIKCGHCDASTMVPVNKFKGGLSDEREINFAVRKFEAKGWKVGNSNKQHRCPACFAAIRNAAEKKRSDEQQRSKVVMLPTAKLTEMASDEQPREMTRDDRRVIFEKLNEVYEGERVGYSNGWTDAKVAKDLGAPRAWVSQVRDEMFGPEAGNEEIKQALAEARKLLAECADFGKSTERLIEAGRSLLHRADKIEKTVIEIAALLK